MHHELICCALHLLIRVLSLLAGPRPGLAPVLRGPAARAALRSGQASTARHPSAWQSPHTALVGQAHRQLPDVCRQGCTRGSQRSFFRLQIVGQRLHVEDQVLSAILVTGALLVRRPEGRQRRRRSGPSACQQLHFALCTIAVHQ